MEHKKENDRKRPSVLENVTTILWVLIRPFIRLYLRIITAIFPFIFWTINLTRVIFAMLVGPFAAITLTFALFVSSFYTVWLALLVLCIRAAPVTSKLVHDTLLFLTDYGRKIWNVTLRPMFGKLFGSTHRSGSHDDQNARHTKPAEETEPPSLRPETSIESKDFVANGSQGVSRLGSAEGSPTHSVYSVELAAESSAQPQRRHRRTRTGSSANRLSGTISPELLRTPLQMPSQNTSQERIRSRRGTNSSPETYFRMTTPGGTEFNGYALKHSRSGSSSTASIKSVGRVSGSQFG